MTHSSIKWPCSIATTSSELCLAGTRFVACLASDGRRTSSRQWHLSELGTLHLLEPPVLGGWRYALPNEMQPTELMDAEQAAKYVLEKARRYADFEPRSAIDLLDDVINLALYPGFLTPSNGIEQFSTVFQALLKGFESHGPAFSAQRATECIYLSAFTFGKNEYLKSCLQCLPEHYVGLLAAHGLTSRLFWRTRHRDALLAAWRYQLLHPDECYSTPGLDWGNKESIPLIERDITADDRAYLLTHAGLTEEDVVHAAGIADIAGLPKVLERSRALLRHLARQSNLELGHEPNLMANLPPDVGLSSEY